MTTQSRDRAAGFLGVSVVGGALLVISAGHRAERADPGEYRFA